MRLSNPRCACGRTSLHVNELHHKSNKKDIKPYKRHAQGEKKPAWQISHPLMVELFTDLEICVFGVLFTRATLSEDSALMHTNSQLFNCFK